MQSNPVHVLKEYRLQSDSKPRVGRKTLKTATAAHWATGSLTASYILCYIIHAGKANCHGSECCAIHMG